MPDLTTNRFKFLTPKGLIPANTMCPFFNKCNRKDERCSIIKPHDFSCGLSRGFDMFYDEIFNSTRP